MESEAGRLPQRPSPEPSSSSERGGTFRSGFGSGAPVTQTWIQIPNSHSLVMYPWASYSLGFGFLLCKMGIIIKLPGGAYWGICMRWHMQCCQQCFRHKNWRLLSSPWHGSWHWAGIGPRRRARSQRTLHLSWGLGR